MKILKLLFLLLIIPTVFHAQKNLTGLWIGTLSNDSTTTRKDQSFEIALTQYKEKVYGYSRMNFIVNDTLYYIVKRVKGSIENDVCEVTDDEIIKHNFPRKPDKGVKLISTFRRNSEDSIWRLDGEWKTTQAKKYYSISGKISLQSEPDITRSKIIPHLEELNLANDIAFYKEAKKAEQNSIAITNSSSIVVDKKEEQKKTPEPALARNETPKTNLPVNTNPEHKQISSAVNPGQETKEQGLIVKKEETKQAAEETVASATLKKTNLPVNTLPAEQKKNVTSEVAGPEIKKQELVVKKEEVAAPATLKKTELPANTLPADQKKDVAVEMSKPEIKKQEPVMKKQETITTATDIVSNIDNKKTETAIIVKPADEKKITTGETKQPELKNPTAAAFVRERKTVAPQIVEFKSDSLQLSLYDNGEIDGDTVSVLLNGEILLAKQGLKASAIKKTIYIQPDSDEINLVLYAENLGKYPPNTGLLVVRDGEDIYQIRFSADLQQNAAIVFRRKK